MTERKAFLCITTELLNGVSRGSEELMWCFGG